MKDATQFHIRPARPEEAGLFYTPHPEEDKRLGTVGHVRMDFGRSGNEFWHVNLYAYGCDLIREDNAVLSPYGLLHRADYEPMLSPIQQKQEKEMTMQ